MKKHIVIDARESGTSTGTYIDKLVSYLHQLNPPYSITILAKPHRREFFEELAPKFSVKVTRFKEFTFAEQLGLLKQIKSLNPDLVFFPAAQQPILYRGKVVTTIQDLTTVRFRNPTKNWLIFTIKRWVYIWVNKIVARKSAALITPSEFVKEDFAKFAKVNSRKFTVTYEAADPISEKPEPLDDLIDKEFIMYVGRPQPHKNLERLIDAFAIVKKSRPGLILVLVGKKDAAYKNLSRYALRQSIDDIIFTGWVSEGQKRWLYEHTSAYVFPSLSEGFGLPPLEAMTHGAPVVSSNATCLPEISQDAALYFDPTSTDDMAEAVKKVLDSKSLRQSLIKKGHAQVKKYSWRRMAQQTLDVFREVLEED